MSIKNWDINTTLNQYKNLRPNSQQDTNYNYDTNILSQKSDSFEKIPSEKNTR